MVGDAGGAESEFSVFDHSLPRRDGGVEVIGNNSEGDFVAGISKGNSALRAERLRIDLSPGTIGRAEAKVVGVESEHLGASGTSEAGQHANSQERKNE